MQRLSRILRIVDNISDKVGKVAGFLILFLTAVLCWEVLVRGAFNAPTVWAHEGSQYLFAAHFMLGGAYSLRWGGMVNVDVLVSRTRPRVRSIISILAAAAFFLFILILIWKGSAMAAYSVKIRETSQTFWGPPLYPFKILVPVGAILVFTQGLAKFIRDWVFAITGKELP